MSQSETVTETIRTPSRPIWRRALPWWAQLGVLLLVFVAGGVVGAMVSTKIIHSRMEYYRQNPESLPDVIIPRLKRQLGLSSEQVEQVRNIIKHRHPRITEYRNERSQAMLDEFSTMEQEIAALLDEHQQSKWHDLASSIRLRFLPPAPDK